MHNLDDTNSTRPGFEPRTYELRATAGRNEPSGPATWTSNNAGLRQPWTSRQRRKDSIIIEKMVV